MPTSECQSVVPHILGEPIQRLRIGSPSFQPYFFTSSAAGERRPCARR